MRKEYDFSESRENPYSNRLKRQITIRLGAASVDSFKDMAAELGMQYQLRPVIQCSPQPPKRRTGR
jgi:predicted DNA binding CopG/RHH family protein